MDSQDNDFDSRNINELVVELSDAWRSENYCPEILPFRQELVDEMKTSLQQQQVSLIL
jgi:hypothetical protein